MTGPKVVSLPPRCPVCCRAIRPGQVSIKMACGDLVHAGRCHVQACHSRLAR